MMRYLDEPEFAKKWNEFVAYQGHIKYLLFVNMYVYQSIYVYQLQTNNIY